MTFDYDEVEDYGDEFETHHDCCDCDERTYGNAMFNCGMLPDDLGGGCSKAGSEECEFDCPFRNQDETD